MKRLMEDELHTARRGRSRTIPPVKHYYVLIGNQQEGPYTLAQLQSFWRKGCFAEATHFWMEGSKDWSPISDIAGTLEEKPRPQRRDPLPMPKDPKRPEKEGSAGLIAAAVIGLTVLLGGIALFIYFVSKLNFGGS